MEERLWVERLPGGRFYFEQLQALPVTLAVFIDAESHQALQLLSETDAVLPLQVQRAVVGVDLLELLLAPALVQSCVHPSFAPGGGGGGGFGGPARTVVAKTRAAAMQSWRIAAP